MNELQQMSNLIKEIAVLLQEDTKKSRHAAVVKLNTIEDLSSTLAMMLQMKNKST